MLLQQIELLPTTPRFAARWGARWETQMFEDPLSHLRVLNDRHDSRHATASSAREDVDGERSTQEFSPRQSALTSGTVRADQILLMRIESAGTLSAGRAQEL